jgi:hypothetical protein
LFVSKLIFADVDFRNQYEKAINNKALAEKMVAALELKTNITPIERGYKGALKMILAKHYYNPLNKLNSFNAGKTELEKAIELLPNSPELIYLRYSCSVNSPSFLNYKKNVQADKAFLVKAIVTLKDEDLKKRISEFLVK